MTTHTHHDHYDLAIIKQIKKNDTILIVPSLGLKDALEIFNKTNVIEVKPQKEYRAKGFMFKTVPAYSISNNSHPRSDGLVGYILNIGEYRYYIAGDTQLVPEIKNVKADVVFLPVDSTINLTVADAIKLVKIINPAVAIPVHDMRPGRVSFKSKDFVKGLEKTDTQGLILRKD